MEIEKKKVAIIGAGPAGIVSLRHLKDIAEVQVFESQEELGGQWNYHENTEEDTENLDKNAYFSMYGYLNGSMYDDLTTNVPKHWMSFKDFWLDKNVETVMSRKRVFKYINDYVEHFNLNDYIKLRTTVKNVKIDETTGHKFKVTIVPTDMIEGTEETFSYFDYVLVCNGRFSIPRMPNFEGESEFEGRVFSYSFFSKI